MMSQQGRENFKNQLTQLVGSIQLTNDLDVHVALLQAPSYQRTVNEKYHDVTKTTSQVCRQYVDLFGIMQKIPNALDILIEDAKNHLKTWGSQPPTFLLCNGNLTTQLTMLPEKTNYLTNGPDGIKRLAQGPDLPAYRGLSIINSRKFSMDTGTAPRDLLRRRVRVAEYYHIPHEWHDKTFEFYDQSRDTMFRLTWDDLERMGDLGTLPSDAGDQQMEDHYKPWSEHVRDEPSQDLRTTAVRPTCQTSSVHVHNGGGSHEVLDLPPYSSSTQFPSDVRRQDIGDMRGFAEKIVRHGKNNMEAGCSVGLVCIDSEQEEKKLAALSETCGSGIWNDTFTSNTKQESDSREGYNKPSTDLSKVDTFEQNATMYEYADSKCVVEVKAPESNMQLMSSEDTTRATGQLKLSTDQDRRGVCSNKVTGIIQDAPSVIQADWAWAQCDENYARCFCSQ